MNVKEFSKSNVIDEIIISLIKRRTWVPMRVEEVETLLEKLEGELGVENTKEDMKRVVYANTA